MKRPRQRRPERRVPRQQRARMTAGAVLDATVLVLQREGLARLTTNRIAEAAGVSIGSLYQYFPDKQAIFQALHQRHVQQVDHLLRRTLEPGVDTPLAGRLCALIAALTDLHARELPLHELLAQVPQRGRQAGFAARAQESLHAALSWSAAGTLRPDPTAHHPLDGAAFVLANMVDALSHGAALRRPPGISLEAAKIEAQRAVLAYLEEQQGLALSARR